MTQYERSHLSRLQLHVAYQQGSLEHFDILWQRRQLLIRVD
jgi:hypothetical protein